MRPIASTWVASMQNIAAPDSARLLMWVKCQSLATPSSAEYWHIGDTTRRFFNVRPRSLIGENRALMRGVPGIEGGDRGSVVSGYGITSCVAGMPASGAMHCVRVWCEPASIVFASAAKQSRIPLRRQTGLLRCARNDGEARSLHQRELQQQRTL